MTIPSLSYRAIFSSDWNECLAPCGPFDFIGFNYPQLQAELTRVFKHYTSNRITLSAAAWQIQRMLPNSITAEQMDHYLDSEFQTYRGVAELIDWCRENRVLFVINTTGMIGYFQRIFAKGLLPPVPVLSAHPMIRFAESGKDPAHLYELEKIEDKSKHTAAVARMFNISFQNIFIMGDSGGDGPHFKWGHQEKAVLIGSMTKPSLQQFCRQQRITIDYQFGRTYQEGEAKDLATELQTDFSELIGFIEERL